ncbi:MULTISPECIES: hypothetical protein [unclassified Microcoleus]|uniref:hypothetical protein n=1 Tax=unclassified Microcoleus TaxID=2642155 RepID=UPI001D3C8779|nr:MULTISPECIES: hypothetical protein [unclassified Microcoleus]MCC3528027.1 hypothetical protein [Microcoleus sp. PH2017_21_RUC_O_A]MCC3540058.1 hypothetical protein [Microcoleus sp. PH2017_22_RUC_O_B]TAG68274.1 MAG: hypothetical protein EAZ25_04290 [Oscillatoriales cyanobacterium]
MLKLKQKSLETLYPLKTTSIALFLPLFLATTTSSTQTGNLPGFPQIEIRGGDINPQKIAQNSLGQIFARVEDNLVKIIRKGDGDTPVAFDTGTNFPMKIGQMPDDRQLAKTGYEIVGYLDASRQRRYFTPNGIKVTGDLARARANSGFPSEGTPVVNIIVREKRTRVFSTWQNVNAFAVRRDAINAVYNGNLRRFKP